MVVLSDKSNNPMGAKKKDKKLAKHGKKGSNNLRASFGAGKDGEAAYSAHMSKIAKKGWVIKRKKAKAAAAEEAAKAAK